MCFESLGFQISVRIFLVDDFFSTHRERLNIPDVYFGEDLRFDSTVAVVILYRNDCFNVPGFVRRHGKKTDLSCRGNGCHRDVASDDDQDAILRFQGEAAFHEQDLSCSGNDFPAESRLILFEQDPELKGAHFILL